MALMAIPRHQAIEASAMAEVLQEALLRPLGGALVVRADATLDTRITGYRWTRVPFFKVLLSGRALLLGAGLEADRWLGPGDAVLFQASSYANVNLTEAVRFVRVTFDEDLTLFGEGHLLGAPPLPENPGEPIEHLRACVHQGDRPRLVADLLAAMRSWQKASPVAAAQLRAGTGFVDALLWSLYHQVQQSAQELAPHNDQRWREILHYLEEQCGGSLNRDGVAAVFSLSGGHLARMFRERSDESFQDTLLRFRLQRARALLRHSTLALQAVALRCGFTSANYFAQAFRRAEGKSPSAWRRDQRA